jgi:Lipid A 3-O-deacylase (PagL)
MTVFFVLLSLNRAAGQQSTNDQSAAAPQPDATLVRTPLDPGVSEWMISAGPAFGIVVFHSAAGHRYTLQTVSWGRVLTAPHGPGALRGRFELAFEVVPIFGQYKPTTTYGIGVTPLLWRWNFETQGRLAPYAELAGGGLWTKDDVPARTTTANFTAHASFGVRYFLRERQTLNFSYRFHHISNGNRLERNPGVNAHVVLVGVSLLRD